MIDFEFGLSRLSDWFSFSSDNHRLAFQKSVTKVYSSTILALEAIQVLRNAKGVGGCPISQKKRVTCGVMRDFLL